MIIFIHNGWHDYLRAALLQARHSNPDQNIFLITDQCTNKINKFASEFNINLVPIDKYHCSASLFSLKYHHSGANPYKYELFCFQRWFILNEFLADVGGSGPGLLLDSDAFLYVDINKQLGVQKTQLTVCNKCGPQFSFFKSPEIIEKYCDYIFDVFTDPLVYKKCQNYITENPNLGVPHVSDMVTLGTFAGDGNLEDTYNPNRPLIFDENIANVNGYKSAFFGKKLFKIDKSHYFETNNHTLKLVGGIHLQGASKRLWPLFVDKSVIFKVINIKSLAYFIFETANRFMRFNIKNLTNKR